MSELSASHFNLFLAGNFLDAQACAELIDELCASPTTQAPVYIQGSDSVLHEDVRKTTSLHPSEETIVRIQELLFAQKSALEIHFGRSLTDCERPQFLRYKPGDFFEPHKDESQRPGAPEHVRSRRVSAIIFLSDEDEGDRPGEYAGGSLGFYGLLKDPRCAHIGLPVKGRAGLLVAFRSDVFHQVTPVTRGERYTVVSWYV